MLNQISFYRIKKGLIYLKHYGVKEFLIRVKERLQTDEVAYETWYKNHRANEAELTLQRNRVWKSQPVISILVPVFCTPKVYLEQMINSVLAQTYDSWELCIANASPEDSNVSEVLERYQQMDGRIKVIEVPENKGIGQNTNAALSIATGDYVGFLDHDDLLAADALYHVAKVIEKNPKVEMLYTDEDKVTEDLSKHFQPHFKPEFNLDLLRSNNYICHLCVIRKALVDQAGGLRGEFNGAQDYDLILRCVEKAESIVRIPRILYHWRVHRASTADNPTSKMYAFDAGKRAIEAHLQRCGEEALVSHAKDLGFYHVNYKLDEEPLISIIIPNKDHIEDLSKCLASIRNSSYKNYEVLVIENNSEEKKTFDFYKEIEDEKVKVLYWEKEFNYSAINNFGASHAKGKYLLLLNNDIEAVEETWLTEMVSNCQRKQVGIVGAKLYFPDQTVQHAGVVVGIGGVAGNMFVGLPKDFSGYMHKANIQHNLSAVTAACLMVKKSVFDEVGGLDENLKVAFNDVDFCLKVREKGHLVVYNPNVAMIHYESKTRGPEDTIEKMERFEREINYMKEKWAVILEKGDPMYNPNLTLKNCDYSLGNNQKE